MRFQEFIEDRAFSPALIANALRTTRAEIAGTLGLGKDAFSRASRVAGAQDADPVAPDAGDPEPGRSRDRIAACGLCLVRAEPLPGFGGATPDQLLREGKADHVHAYLDRIMAGGYA